MNDLSLNFIPLIATPWIWILAIIALILIGAHIFSMRNVPYLRIIVILIFLFFLTQPTLQEEKREHVPNIAAIIIDQSTSQNFGKRTAQAESALQHIKDTFAVNGNIELRITNAPPDATTANQTYLFETLETLTADIPQSRFAGTIFITDGQVHDAPNAANFTNADAPFHVLLTGEDDETDRRITLINAPSFGIVDQNITIKFRIDDTANIPPASAQFASVELTTNDGQTMREIVRIAEEHIFTLPVKHAGQNVIELSVEPLPGELTLRNNKVAVDFQGVRDRLRVLLVSGKPHAGGRTWRDMLTSDPSVDLVHFTILREPDKIDGTPQSEMSLIAFPFEELFEHKLYDFDLIIFDRYRLNRILPDQYFENIARYVREGGAFLEASGPAYASEDSIFYTALGNILPAAPNGEIFTQPFTPQLTELGKFHPVTRDLQNQQWGKWQRQIGLQPPKGDALMSDANNRPLLILDRVDKGRVAQIASDHIWLWARGIDGGGPYAELLRRTVHWLMKEPELDEQALNIQINGATLTIQRADIDRESDNIHITMPDGTAQDITLTPNENGTLQHVLTTTQTGIYKFETSDNQTRFAVLGTLNPPEFQDVIRTEKIIAPITNKTGGGILHLSDTTTPDIRLMQQGRFSGRNWIALKDHNAYNVTGVSEKPLLPTWAILLLLITSIISSWWFEGRRT